MTSTSPAAHVDRIRADYRDGLIARPDAIAEIRSQLDLTELGGADVLDGPRFTDRFIAAASRPAI
jgi:hypothetical protein